VRDVEESDRQQQQIIVFKITVKPSNFDWVFMKNFFFTPYFC
jgi:hypothetical protein